jgi:2'-5' RNA ligase
MRAFIAIDLPAGLRDGLAAVQGRLKRAGADASWPRPEGIHLTLKFLGELADAQVPVLMQALAPAVAAVTRFPLAVAGVGTFPPAPAPARVVWLGVAGAVDRLLDLQSATERAAIAAGLAADPRPYTPHLTLGRIKRIRSRDQWRRGLQEVASVRLPEFEVAAVALIASDLRPSGAVYRELGRAPLG